jgi:DNA end-binding protein Ku
MALNLIEGFSGKWEPERYEDTYTAALRDVIKAKLKGHEIHRAPEPAEDETPDLMEALRLSVEQMQRTKRTARNGSKTKSKPRSRAKSKSR